MLKISNTVSIPEQEIEISAIRSQGAGGQHVNKVSSAIHLRFDIAASSLPPGYKKKLLALADRRITKDGVIIIKAQEFRTQEKNKQAALLRLQSLIKSAAMVKKKRLQTKPPAAAEKKRLESKTKHSKTKTLRKKVDF